ncbi:PREDICTED: proline-rich receptor-like protein kinase PERK2 [Pygoscelis adeliae]|uniref:proline-rich receptor-like protein kinase PERK2 n=1 Tax=Pygoscelis adeliae TaxID=9238 RepID=UPI0004F5028E|nr:PREDICTED: proline-rich receptor-like protein kinase PERK2 [Pygoscelis adeliae]
MEVQYPEVQYPEVWYPEAHPSAAPALSPRPTPSAGTTPSNTLHPAPTAPWPAIPCGPPHLPPGRAHPGPPV